MCRFFKCRVQVSVGVKQCMQEWASELNNFVTMTAKERFKQHKTHTIRGEDIVETLKRGDSIRTSRWPRNEVDENIFLVLEFYMHFTNMQTFTKKSKSGLTNITYAQKY